MCPMVLHKFQRRHTASFIVNFGAAADDDDATPRYTPSTWAEKGAQQYYSRSFCVRQTASPDELGDSGSRPNIKAVNSRNSSGFSSSGRFVAKSSGHGFPFKIDFKDWRSILRLCLNAVFNTVLNFAGWTGNKSRFSGNSTVTKAEVTFGTG